MKISLRKVKVPEQLGTDLQGLMLLQGERVLFFLGDAAREWLELRVTSILVRVALVEALAAVWRAGPNALMFFRAPVASCC